MGLLQCILIACIFYFRLISVHPHYQIINEFQNLFDAIGKSDTKNSEIHRNILKQEIAKEQQAFHALKEQLNVARKRSSNKKMNFYGQSNTGNFIAAKRRAYNREYWDLDGEPDLRVYFTDGYDWRKNTRNFEDIFDDMEDLKTFTYSTKRAGRPSTLKVNKTRNPRGRPRLSSYEKGRRKMMRQELLWDLMRNGRPGHPTIVLNEERVSEYASLYGLTSTARNWHRRITFDEERIRKVASVRAEAAKKSSIQESILNMTKRVP